MCSAHSLQTSHQTSHLAARASPPSVTCGRVCSSCRAAPWAAPAPSLPRSHPLPRPHHPPPAPPHDLHTSRHLLCHREWGARCPLPPTIPPSQPPRTQPEPEVWAGRGVLPRCPSTLSPTPSPATRHPPPLPTLCTPRAMRSATGYGVCGAHLLRKTPRRVAIRPTAAPAGSSRALAA